MSATTTLPLASAILQVAQRRGILDRYTARGWGRHLLANASDDLARMRQAITGAHDLPASDALLDLLPSADLVIGGWRLLANLGHGPAGTTWLSRHADGRYGVLKQLLGGADAPLRARAHAEAVYRQRHHLAPVMDVVTDHPTPAVVHRWIPGRSGEGFVAQHPDLDERRCLRLMRHLARTLAAIHDAGRIHGDLRPGNCLIDTDGHLWVAHHGLAITADGRVAEGIDLERQQGVLWRAPELLEDDAQPTPASDVYAAGCLAFYLLTGQPPYPATTTLARLQHRTAPRPDVRHQRKDVGLRTAQTIAKAIAVDPAERYADGAALRDAIYRCRAALLDRLREDADDGSTRPTDSDDLGPGTPEVPADSHILRSTGDFQLEEPD